MKQVHPTANFSSLGVAILALTGGLAVLVAGGEMLISGAVKLAARLGMSSLLIGLTVVAFGTSMPELFVSVSAALRGHPDIMLGNIIGSNIANIGMVLAISAILYPLTVRFQRLAKEFYLLIIVSLTLIAFAYFGVFPRLLGISFICLLTAYTIFACRAETVRRSTAARSDAATRYTPFLYIISLCTGGLVCMWFGSEYFIKGAVDLARFLGLSELVIGLTMAAIGTSLPELASSLSAIRRREGDILVGNILGSNLFNLLMVMGSTGAILPFHLPSTALSRDLPVMTAFFLIIIPLSLSKRHKIRRWHGALLLAAYLGYIYWLY